MALKKVVDNQQEQKTDDPKVDARARRQAEEQRRRARTLAKQQQAAERIAAASTELASGITEASSARDQLATAISEVAAGAEEAAGACQESLAAVTQISVNLGRQKDMAELSGEKAETLKSMLERTGAKVLALVENVNSASERQGASAAMMDELGKQAVKINEAVQQVMRIADQTNLLALNAAIEAGRAGKHGKGFAVVADTVRALAEVSEKSANDISQLSESIQQHVCKVGESVRDSAEAAVAEAEKGQLVTEQIASINHDMDTVYSGAQELLDAMGELNIATDDIQKGSEAIAAAAEEQSAAAEEVVASLEQQAQALLGAEQASQELESVADDLKNSTDIVKSAEEVAAAAEELSATVEEINRSAEEISTAIDQISRGAEQAAAASEQAAAGISQVEKGVISAEEKASSALKISHKVQESLSENKQNIDEMIAGINAALETGRGNLKAIEEMESLVHSIEKIIDTIGTVAVKTSMLAVNGAVEAARAGEYGKGFAVVSGDIQNLADEASENLDQIRDLVKTIQGMAVRVRNELSDVASSAENEVAKAREMGADLDGIQSVVEEIVQGNQQIQQAATEISTAVSQAQKGMEQIAAAAEQAGSNSQEAAAAARQQAQGAEELAVAIEEIASIADELQSA